MFKLELCGEKLVSEVAGFAAEGIEIGDDTGGTAAGGEEGDTEVVTSDLLFEAASVVREAIALATVLSLAAACSFNVLVISVLMAAGSVTAGDLRPLLFFFCRVSL